jgi:hypothetical protein
MEKRTTVPIAPDMLISRITPEEVTSARETLTELERQLHHRHPSSLDILAALVLLSDQSWVEFAELFGTTPGNARKIVGELRRLLLRSVPDEFDVAGSERSSGHPDLPSKLYVGTDIVSKTVEARSRRKLRSVAETFSGSRKALAAVGDSLVQLSLNVSLFSARLDFRAVTRSAHGVSRSVESLSDRVSKFSQSIDRRIAALDGGSHGVG